MSSGPPPERFGDFWDLVRDALAPPRRACFIDSGPGDMAAEEVLVEQPAPAVRRKLEDGSAHRIVKVFHEPNGLVRALHGLGWSARVWPVGATMIAGLATPTGQRLSSD